MCVIGVIFVGFRFFINKINSFSEFKSLCLVFQVLEFTHSLKVNLSKSLSVRCRNFYILLMKFL
ncbi:hypothetical protein FFZ99_02680 [Leptospira interrogans]|nr:hypothetical protein B2G47_12050 [Leptospira interrogans serovar Canicola]KAA1269320.1 hypothetical protein C5473_16240 [Leptospira interrogans serovar Weerasinghe]KAA1290076.1 hypothetical protein C4X99_06290 [Leptospira interrogans serovar Geyaweera]OMH69142.1 hypothetical protein BW243_05120 [Leptospira interrogans serovar Pomona]QCO36481.1 hypothetical protein E4412_04015 [Leptospira interrogans]